MEHFAFFKKDFYSVRTMYNYEDGRKYHVATWMFCSTMSYILEKTNDLL